MRRTKGETARLEIEKAAKRLFARHGYQDTSFQMVADAVGVSQSAVLHHYRTKRELYAAVIERMVVENADVASSLQDPGDDARERLMKHFEINWRWGVESDHNPQIMTGLFQFASYDAEFRTIYARVLAGAREKVRAIVLAGVRERLFGKDADPELVAEALHDGLLGILLTVVAGERRPDAKARALAKWRTLVDRVVGVAQPKA